MEITNSKNNNHLKLSIQVRLDGLSFCILHSGNKEILWYKSINFSKGYNPVKILEQIELIYDAEKILEEPVDEMVILFSNELYSFVPQEFFIEDEASHYLKFNTKILKTDVVAYDYLEGNNLVNVYIPYINITNYFFDKYGEFEYKHSIAVLAQEVLRRESGHKAKAYLNNYNGYYDLVVVKNSSLLLSNSFKYETPEDFIYYLLFTAEQLTLDPSEFDLILLGDIDKDSPFYQITYTYIKNVEFLIPEIQLSPAEFQLDNFQRKEFILLKSLKCE